MVPRAWRFICFGFEIRRCRLWATLALTLPEAVRLKRFFAPLLVFILGIFGPFEKGVVTAARHALSAPARPCRRVEPRVIALSPRKGQWRRLHRAALHPLPPSTPLTPP